MDLRPAGYAWPDQMALAVTWETLAEQRDEFGSLGPWSDDRHLAAQDVEKLRQFVDAVAAQDRADFRRAVVRGRRPDRAAARFCVHRHRAELEQVEHHAVASDTPLPVQDRAAGFEVDRARGDEHDRP